MAYPKVVPSIYIPLDHIALSFRKIRVEAVGLSYPSAFLVTGFLMLLIMAMLGIELWRVSLPLSIRGH